MKRPYFFNNYFLLKMILLYVNLRVAANFKNPIREKITHLDTPFVRNLSTTSNSRSASVPPLSSITFN